MLRVISLDHLVLTVTDIDRTVRFYVDVLGVQCETFVPSDGSTRTALKFGQQKINLHSAEKPFEPKAKNPIAGSADLCFLVAGSLADWAAHLTANGVPIEAGPVVRTGATGPIVSLYLRDPDGNLIEMSVTA